MKKRNKKTPLGGILSALLFVKKYSLQYRIKAKTQEPHYYDGLSMMGKLHRIYGPDDILTRIRAIDLKACATIDITDPRYKKVLEDPTRIPGLENAA